MKRLPIKERIEALCWCLGFIAAMALNAIVEVYA